MRRLGALITRLSVDERGVTAAFTAMAMAFVLGVAGLGTEAANWYVTKRSMQGAADAAAYSAGVAGGLGQSYSADGASVAANFGYVNGTNGVTVQVNNPPTQGAFAGQTSAYEVIIKQPQPQLFSKLVNAGPATIQAHAVANNTTSQVQSCITTLGTQNGAGVTINGGDTITLGNCNLTDLATGSNSLTMNGNASLSANQVILGGTDLLNGQATLTSTNGVEDNFSETQCRANPYCNVNPTVPSSCDHATVVVITGTQTISPGKYCGGIIVNAGTVLLNPGIYYINDGSFTINGNSNVTGVGVTIMFTSDNGTYGTFTVNGSGTVTLTAPTTTGWNQGFVFFESASAPTSTVTFNGGNHLNLTGMLYFPSQNLTYNGQGTSTCTLIWANKITFNGNANLGGNCSGVPGTPTDPGATTKLVE